MSLIALTDKVLRESGLFMAQDSQAQTSQAELFLVYLSDARMEPAPPAETKREGVNPATEEATLLSGGQATKKYEQVV